MRKALYILMAVMLLGCRGDRYLENYHAVSTDATVTVKKDSVIVRDSVVIRDSVVVREVVNRKDSTIITVNDRGEVIYREKYVDSSTDRGTEKYSMIEAGLAEIRSSIDSLLDTSADTVTVEKEKKMPWIDSVSVHVGRVVAALAVILLVFYIGRRIYTMVRKE